MKNLFVAFLLALALSAVIAQAQTSHSVTLTSSDPSCASLGQCNVQVYRATGSCPASGIGSLNYTKIAPAVTDAMVGGTPTFVYIDSAVSEGQTYCYYETATFTAGGGPSAASNTFQGVIPVTSPTVAPTLTGVVK